MRSTYGIMTKWVTFHDDLEVLLTAPERFWDDSFSHVQHVLKDLPESSIALNILME